MLDVVSRVVAVAAFVALAIGFAAPVRADGLPDFD